MRKSPALIAGLLALLIAGGVICASPQAGRAADIGDNLISCWDLNETSGTRSDSKGTNNLTDNNTVGYQAGKQGNAASYVDANNESLSITNNSTLQTGDIDFTFAVWVYLHTTTTNRNIIYKFASSTRGYYLAYNSSSSRIRFSIGDGGTNSTVLNATTLGAPNVDTWYFVIAWHDNTANKIKIKANNGTTDESSALAFVPGVTTNDFFLGDANMEGAIDSVMFWKRDLTTDEMTWLYNSGSGRACSDVVAAPTATPTATATSTPTPTPTITPTPTATPTPAGEERINLSSGNYATLKHTITYGEIYTTAGIIALSVIIALFGFAIWSLRWLR